VSEVGWIGHYWILFLTPPHYVNATDDESLLTNQENSEAKTEVSQEKMEALLEGLRAWRKDTTACQEVTCLVNAKAKPK
jgi:hypothetical protein